MALQAASHRPSRSGCSNRWLWLLLAIVGFTALGGISTQSRASSFLPPIRSWKPPHYSRGCRQRSATCSYCVSSTSPDQVKNRWPVVSVQVVTFDRPELLLEALEQISAQDYPGTIEVVVADDSERSALPLIQGLNMTKDVKYLHMSDRRYTIGEKRNIAVDEACSDAEVMCIWDDDDVFPVDRIRQQVSRLVARGAPCSSIGVRWVYSIADGTLRRCIGLPYPLENTFVFRRDWLSDQRRFHHTNFAYMEHLFDSASNWYSDAQPIPGDELPFIYVRLAAPTASLLPGGREFCVVPVQESLLLGSDLAAKGGAASYQLDKEFLALARSILLARFPDVVARRIPYGSQVLERVKSAVATGLRNDLQSMKSSSSIAAKFAIPYAFSLGLCGGHLRCFGPAGEQPEGCDLPQNFRRPECLESLYPPPSYSVGPPSEAFPTAQVSNPEVSLWSGAPGEALLEIEAALKRLS